MIIGVEHTLTSFHPFAGSRDDSEIPNYHHRPTGTVTPIRDVSASRDSARSLKRKPPNDSCITTVHAACQTDKSGPEAKNATPMLSLCKELANMVLQRTRGMPKEKSTIDFT
jgi:hypothetical protein